MRGEPPRPLVGAPVRRQEDRRLVTGEGLFLDDVRQPEMLYAAFIRSPLPRAIVRQIHTDAAAALPGVLRVITAADLGAANRPLMMMVPSPPPTHPITQRPLASGEVRFEGEIVAAVLAERPALAEDAAQAVRVDYGRLDPLMDPHRALEPAAPLLHPGAASNEVGSWQTRAGDPAAAFTAADVVVDLELEVGRMSGQPLETRGVVAHYGRNDDLLTVWTSTQVPHRIRAGLSAALARSEAGIRVVAPDVGGGFGSKLCLGPEEVICAYAALASRRPVKWIESRTEHMVAGGHARGQTHRVRVAARRDGTVLGLHDEFVHDNGAYAPYGLRLPLVTLLSLLGPYRIPAFEGRVTSVFTNKAPVIPFRGAGQPEAVFVLERAMDRVGAVLGIEPSEVRRRNLLPDHAAPVETGLSYPGAGPIAYDTGSHTSTFNDVMASVDLRDFRAGQIEARRRGRHLGMGVACYVEGTGAGTFEAAVVRVDATGLVTVHAGICQQGQGHETILAQICADTVGQPLDRIRVKIGDTASMPYGVGTWGSRVAAVAGAAVAEAARRVRDKATRVAARLLEVAPSDIRWHGGDASVAGAPARRLTLGALAEAAASGRGPLMLSEGPGLEAAAHFAPSGITYGNGAHLAVVEVDTETGGVQILRYVVSHDCGRTINPVLVEGQVLGGIAQGIGTALYEQIVYDEAGQLLTASLADYALPRAMQIPKVELHQRVTPSLHNPQGVKGVGEAGTIPVCAVLAAAIEDALAPWGVTVDAVPATPARIRTWLERAPVAGPAASVIR